jgi:DNA/RNA-binding domain of Phe-tRNA-synthetase-like protein
MESAPDFHVSQNWRSAYPAAHVGVLVMSDVANPAHHGNLDIARTDLAEALKQRYVGADRPSILEHPVASAYQSYYRRFNKTYHVQLQLESIVLKGKPIPTGAALVAAMFMAELDTLLLTAGHDLDALHLPLTLDIATGSETYVLLRGSAQSPKAGDMMISDQEGIVSSIVYGPDQRTQLTAQTRNVVFTVYGPDGIREDDIRRHLGKLQGNVQLVAPDARVDLLEIFGT